MSFAAATTLIGTFFAKAISNPNPSSITSGRVARKVVAALNLKFNDVHHTFLTQVGYLWTDSWLGKHYRAFKEWLFPPGASEYKATPEEIETARTIDAFKDSITVDAVPGTTVGRVIALAPSYRAAEIANKVVDVYLAERASVFLNEADTAYKSLNVELERAAADLRDLDQHKLEFESTNKVVLDFEKDKLLVANWVTLQTAVNELKANIASLEASLAVAEQQMRSAPREIISSTKLQDSQTKSSLETRLSQLTTSLQVERERYVPTSPEVTQLEKLVAETQESLKQEPDKVVVGQDRILNPLYAEAEQRRSSVIGQLASARAALDAKRGPLLELEQRMAQIPGLTKTILEQARMRDGLETRYKLLRDRAMQADVTRATVASAPPSVRVIDYASPPMKPIWPRTIILVPAALALGLFLGIVLALLTEVFSSRVTRDRLAMRPEIPLYAVIDLRNGMVSDARGTLSRDSRSVVERLRRAT